MNGNENAILKIKMCIKSMRDLVLSFSLMFIFHTYVMHSDLLLTLCYIYMN